LADENEHGACLGWPPKHPCHFVGGSQVLRDVTRNVEIRRCWCAIERLAGRGSLTEPIGVELGIELFAR